MQNISTEKINGNIAKPLLCDVLLWNEILEKRI